MKPIKFQVATSIFPTIKVSKSDVYYIYVIRKVTLAPVHVTW